MLAPFAFARRRDDRVIAGVAGGFAATHGVDPLVIRAAVAVLTLAGGLGVAIYVAGFALAERLAPAPRRGSAAAPLRPEPPPMPVQPRRNAAVGLVSVGLLFGARGVGLWPGDAVMAPVALLTGGAVVLVSAGAEQRRADRNPLAVSRFSAVLTGPWGPVRLVVGGALIVLAILALGQPPRWLSGVYVALVGGALALVGAAVVLAPWLDRIGRQLNAERDERIRSEERAAVAAHLHDSVLQTLALIQRSADDPRRTVTLARRQERQLRSWLYGDTAEPAALSRAVATVAVEVEETHDVDVDPVVVGDAPVDDQLAGLVAALREAVVNAAKHAGVEEVSVYVEVEPDAVSAFIRDRGKGFDPAVVPSDRHGIAASIVARMQRLGGEAEIDAAPGHGTEVRLRLPRQPAAALRATRPPERRR